jgi:hypothetical protein
MSVKKFKDLSSFGFTKNRDESSAVTVLYPNTSNDPDTNEAPTDITIGTSDSILVSSINNHASPDKQPAAALSEASSSLDSVKLKNDIGNYINNRLTLSNALRYLLLTQHFIPDEKFKWPFIERKTNNAIDAYVSCNGTFFPNIKVLLQIYATLPVTTATGERSFSTLKLLKTYLRSTMSESRLNGLAMMYIHAMVNIDIEQVIDKFSKRKNRKLEFLI